MKENHKIRTSDGYYLYATLEHAGKTIPETVAIIVNGFLCDKDAAPYLNASKWFGTSEIAVFRFNFFDSQTGARSFADTDVETQISDLEEAIDYVKRLGAKNIFLLAHSFGAHLALLSDLSQVDGIVMWDPSLRVPHNVGASAQYSEQNRNYILSSGQPISADAFRSLCSQPDSPALIRQVSCPIHVISAGAGMLIESGKTLLSHNRNNLNKFTILNGAGHFFNQPGKEEQLYLESISWIEFCLDNIDKNALPSSQSKIHPAHTSTPAILNQNKRTMH